METKQLTLVEFPSLGCHAITDFDGVKICSFHFDLEKFEIVMGHGEDYRGCLSIESEEWASPNLARVMNHNRIVISEMEWYTETNLIMIRTNVGPLSITFGDDVKVMWAQTSRFR